MMFGSLAAIPWYQGIFSLLSLKGRTVEESKHLEEVKSLRMKKLPHLTIQPIKFRKLAII